MKALLSILAIILITGCSSTRIEHLDSLAFIKQVKEINQMNSAYKTTYIGDTASRIYLEYYTAISSTGNGKTIVYWTEKKNLSQKQIIEIMKNKDNKVTTLDQNSAPRKSGK